MPPENARGEICVASIAYGASATYTYDALNLLASVTDNRLVAQGAASGLTTYNFDPANNLQTYTYPNGAVTTVTVDNLNRPTVVGSTKVSALTNYTYTPGPGPAGNRTKVIELGGRTVNDMIAIFSTPAERTAPRTIRTAPYRARASALM